MDYKNFIKPNERVVYYPNWDELSWMCDYEKSIVQIGEYKPYYTDGTPETDDNVYEEFCQVEAYPEDKRIQEYQFRLHDLHPIKKVDEETYVIYGTHRCKLIGYVLSYDLDDYEWEEDGYAVVEESDGKWKVVDEDDFEIEQQLGDLTKSELEELRDQIYLGSGFLAHYMNTFGIDPSELCDACDNFWAHLRDEYGEEEAEEHDTPAEFADFIYEFY